eukprot:6188719-Pleurochrysis_carterae.AAC.1
MFTSVNISCAIVRLLSLPVQSMYCDKLTCCARLYARIRSVIICACTNCNSRASDPSVTCRASDEMGASSPCLARCESSRVCARS